MDILLDFVKCFIVGGFICFIGQLLLNYTKLTSGRILVIFLISGVILQAV
ncbi:MAG: SpoVA/SpoVAEb family sporulation membrane protein, partial [Clostridia bacterium]|nr:SpoVA/SpoVAEb family sporulation membrane protein [Clostridia bacterium]